MDWSSIDFLSGLVDGGPGELDLRKVDESESSGVSVLSFDDSGSDDLSAALEKVLEMSLVVREGKVSDNYVGGLLSLVLVLDSLDEAVWLSVSLLSLLGLVSWDFDFDVSSHHFLVVEQDGLVDGLFSLELDESSSLRRAVWVLKEFDVDDLSALFEEFLQIVLGGLEVHASDEHFWVLAGVSLVLVELLGFLLLSLLLFWLRLFLFNGFLGAGLVGLFGRRRIGRIGRIGFL